MISLEKRIMTHFEKLSKNVGDLGKLIGAKGFKSCPKFNKSHNLVTWLDPKYQKDTLVLGIQ